MTRTCLACRLDSLADQQVISRMFLSAMDGCSEALQKEIILLLPELLSEDEHEVQYYHCTSTHASTGQDRRCLMQHTGGHSDRVKCAGLRTEAGRPV